MKTTLTGTRLAAKLSACPSDAYPHGVTESDDGTLLINGEPFDRSASYVVTDNVRQRDAESVSTIDSDWSVALESESDGVSVEDIGGGFYEAEDGTVIFSPEA